MVLQALSSSAIQLPARRFLWAAAAAQQPSSPQKGSLPKDPPKLSTLPTGELVASWENYQPISRVAVAFKAGSRYEDSNNLGVSHCLRNCAGFSTKKATIFGITRNLQLNGANIKATNTRELLIYTLECHRDKLKATVPYFASAIVGQVFKPWEITDYLPRMKIDVATLKQRPSVLVLETLHKAAFRTDLGNSLYTPEFMLGKHNTAMLSNFVSKCFSPKRMAVSGVGMDHDTALEIANFLKLEDYQEPVEAAPALSKYAGGEIRIENDDPYAHVAVAACGVNLKDPQEALAAGVLQHVLGTGPQVKRGLPPTKLMQAALKATDKPFAVSALNINYTDGGLFGFYVAGQAEDMSRMLRSLIDEVSNVKCGVSDKEVQIAKERVRAFIHMAGENSTDLAEEFCWQALSTGKVYSAHDIDKMLDSVTSNDVNEVAKKITVGKPALAAVGNLSQTPYLDQIK